MSNALPKVSGRAEGAEGSAGKSPSAASAERLITFYVVVVALALEKTAENLFPEVKDAGSPPGASRAVQISLSLATIATLVPFAHGALRHLDVQYIHGTAGKKVPVRRWALLADFLALFMQGILFLAMTRYSTEPGWFLRAFGALLAIDIGWGIASQTMFLRDGRSAKEVFHGAWRHLKRLLGRTHEEWPQLSWAYNNVLFLIPIGALTLVANSGAVSRLFEPEAVALTALVLATCRTVSDYALAWGFYFPLEEAQEEAAAPDPITKAYARTTFTARTPLGEVRIRVGETNALLDTLLDDSGQTEWAYITAWNPGSVRLDDGPNTQAQQALEKQVRELGLAFFAGHGVPDGPGWTPEPSLLVLGIGEADAVAIGRRYGQNAVVVGVRGQMARLISCGG